MAQVEMYKQAVANAEAGFATYFILLLASAGVVYFWCIQVRSLAAYFSVFADAWNRYRPHLTRAAAGLPGALLVGCLLRLPQMNDVLWFDETFTAALARLDVPQLLTVVTADVHPPTNYLITWLIVHAFGDSEVTLRIPALLAGLCAIYLMHRLALNLFSRRVALLSAWLIALMPSAIMYSNEARQYSLLVCLVFGAAIALFEKRRGWFVGLGAAVAWTHNLGFFYLAALGLAALYYHRRAWLLAVLAAWGIAALWLPVTLYQASTVEAGFWITFTWPGLLMPLFNMTLTSQIVESLALLASGPFLAVFGLAIVLGLPWAARARAGLVWLALFAGVPLAVAFVSWLWTPVFLHRALLPSVLIAVPILAKFLLETAYARLLWRGLVGFGLVVALAGFYVPGQGNTIEGREMEELCAGADAIVNTNLATQFITSYYIRDVPSYLAPTANDPGMKLADYALEALGWEIIDNPLVLGTDVCVLVTDTPFSQGAQWLIQYLEPDSWISIRRDYSNFYGIEYYRLFIS